jgi:hypothetical protein
VFQVVLRTQTFFSLNGIKWGLNNEVRIAIREQLDGWEIEYQ